MRFHSEMGRFFSFFMLKTLWQTHKKLWATDFGKAWGTLTLEKKIVIILVLNHTIAILTLIEMLVLKK
jgi:hypothetical protein